MTTVSPPDSTPAEMAAITEAASADLAARLGVDTSAIVVVMAEAVTWPDGRLGCTDLALPYSLEPVDGYRLVLEHEGTRYHFHVGSDAIPKLCEGLTRRAKGPGSPEPSIPPPIK